MLHLQFAFLSEPERLSGTVLIHIGLVYMVPEDSLLGVNPSEKFHHHVQIQSYFLDSVFYP